MEKRAYLAEMFSPLEIAAMEEVKAGLDPLGLANRGKVFPPKEEAHA
jgi:glycolate oxidase